MLHIDLPTRAEIEKLAGHRGSPSLSIYLRTTPVTRETPGDRIELKNLLKTAIAQMEASDTPKRAIWPIQQSEALRGRRLLGRAGQQPRPSAPQGGSGPSGCPIT